MVHEMFPYLRVKNSVEAIAFYTQAFGAVERFRLTEPSGRVGHAELQLGPHVLMLSDEFPEYGLMGPSADRDSGFCIHLHVDNADTVAARAVTAGATMLSEISDAFYGERGGRLRDPFGHVWLIGHQIEEVAPQEMQRRYTQLLGRG